MVKILKSKETSDDLRFPHFQFILGDKVVHATDWKVVAMDDVKQEESNLISVKLPDCNGPSSLAYLWAESPVTVTHGLPIYSTNQYRLPAGPWWKDLTR